MNSIRWHPALLGIIVLVSVALVTAASAQNAQPHRGKNLRPGPGPAAEAHPTRILVKPKAGVDPTGAPLAKLHDNLRGKVLRRFPGMNGLMLVESPAGLSAEGLLAAYRADPIVAYAEPDYRVSVVLTPNDPKFLDGSLWGLNNSGQEQGQPDADIDAPEGWSLQSQAPGVIVAVIDTGIRHTHEDLAANMWINTGEIPGNGIDDDGDGFVDDVHGINAIAHTGTPADDNGHGTHVAGTIGAVGGNGLGVVGIAWRVRLMACKFADATGSGYISDAITCIDFARLHGANIISASWGSSGYSQALLDAILSAREAGIIFVAASGNNNQDADVFPFYPAAYNADNIVSVAATTRSDTLAYFSNYGAGSVDVAAPGSQIISTWKDSDSAYTVLDGTSMATPHVSGLFALMLARFPAENYFQLLNRVFASVDPLSDLAGRSRTGGRINLLRALNSSTSAPGNDNFAKAARIASTSFALPAINVDATQEPGEPLHAGATGGKSIWFGWTTLDSGILTLATSGSAFNTLLAVYVGTSLPNLARIAENDDDPAGGVASRVTFEVGPGTNYWIAVDGFGGASGSVILQGSFFARPRNDNFATPFAITGSLATVTSSNVAATKEPGEPLYAGNDGGRSVWWSWTAAVSGPATISTTGSDFNTLLGVYTGTALMNLALIAANDDESAGLNTSRVTFDATAGVAYAIAVDGFNGASGKLTLNTPPSNDAFDHRLVLTGNSPAAVGFNTLASKEPGEPVHAGNLGGHSIWWSWTAPSSGPAIFATTGSTFDTLLAVYRGSALNSLSLVAENDNDPFGGSSSHVTVTVEAGVTYQIAVDGAAGAAGMVQLSIGGSYQFVDLGVLPGFWGSVAYGINNRGMVAGAVLEPPSSGYTPHAVIWTSEGGMQRLFTNDLRSAANDINDAGQVVGQVTLGTRTYPFIWQNGVVTDLGAYGEAFAINNAGEVVGWSVNEQEQIHGFLWKNGVLADLGAVGTNRSWAFDINDAGFIGGYGGPEAGPSSPLYWTERVPVKMPLPAGADEGQILSVNALSQSAGWYRVPDGSSHAFIFDDGVFRDLGPTANGWSIAVSMNSAGQVVGDNQLDAFLWENGQWTDLNTLLSPGLNAQLFFAYEVNERGQIAGGCTLNGTTHGYVLIPLAQPASPPIIVAPRKNQKFYAPAPIEIAVTFAPSVTNVAAVKFFAGAGFLGAVSNAPFNFTWTNAAPGAYALTAEATFAASTNRLSRPVPIVVEARPPLTVKRGGTAGAGVLQISWPITIPSYALLAASNLVPPIFWAPVTEPILVNNGERRVTIPPTSQMRFFRLIQE